MSILYHVFTTDQLHSNTLGATRSNTPNSVSSISVGIGLKPYLFPMIACQVMEKTFQISPNSADLLGRSNAGSGRTKG